MVGHLSLEEAAIKSPQQLAIFGNMSKPTSTIVLMMGYDL